jgi:feruloyl esterase
MKKFAAIFGLVAVGVFAEGTYGAPQSCEQLAKMQLPNTKVTAADVVAAGAFVPPAGMWTLIIGDPAFYRTLPAFCRVLLEDSPTADSDIKIEVWLPASGWNGKFRGQGNGGFGGQIDYRGLAVAILQGYATAATDTGTWRRCRMHAGPLRTRRRLSILRIGQFTR